MIFIFFSLLYYIMSNKCCTRRFNCNSDRCFCGNCIKCTKCERKYQCQSQRRCRCKKICRPKPCCPKLCCPKQRRIGPGFKCHSVTRFPVFDLTSPTPIFQYVPNPGPTCSTDPTGPLSLTVTPTKTEVCITLTASGEGATGGLASVCFRILRSRPSDIIPFGPTGPTGDIPDVIPIEIVELQLVGGTNTSMQSYKPLRATSSGDIESLEVDEWSCAFSTKDIVTIGLPVLYTVQYKISGLRPTAHFRTKDCHHITLTVNE